MNEKSLMAGWRKWILRHTGGTTHHFRAGWSVSVGAHYWSLLSRKLVIDGRGSLQLVSVQHLIRSRVKRVEPNVNEQKTIVLASQYEVWLMKLTRCLIRPFIRSILGVITMRYTYQLLKFNHAYKNLHLFVLFIAWPTLWIILALRENLNLFQLLRFPLHSHKLLYRAWTVYRRKWVCKIFHGVDFSAS